MDEGANWPTYIDFGIGGLNNTPPGAQNGEGATTFPFSGPFPNGCAIGVLQSLYSTNGPKVPSITQVQTAVANYWQKKDPTNPNNPYASEVGVTKGVWYGTLVGAVQMGLQSFGYSAGTSFFNRSDPATLQDLVNTYHAVGLTINIADANGQPTVNHAVMYDGSYMYTSAPTTQDGHASLVPMTPAQMAAQVNSSSAFFLKPKD